MISSRPLLCLTGTTGSGKNAVGARVAESLGGEVLSLDSMKVYRGMDIGTAKPSAEDLGRAPHHMLDILDPSDRMDLRRYLDQADAIIADRHAAGTPVVVVGGTWMYLTGLLYGVYEGPSRDLAFRERLREDYETLGAEAVHARLVAIDPASAERINPNDYQRLERALEVHALTGEKPSELRRGWFEAPRYDADMHVLTWPRDELRRRIDERVDRMLSAGWIEEVRRIRDGGGFSREAAMALGYRELLAVLDGMTTEAAARERIKTKTWQFSRRQLTWMNKFPDAAVKVCTAADTKESLAEAILASFRPRW